MTSAADLTYANVMSTIGVVLLLGGAAALAAAQLGKNSVGTKQLKANAVTTAKIKKNAVTKAKIKAGAVDGSKVADGSLDRRRHRRREHAVHPHRRQVPRREHGGGDQHRAALPPGFADLHPGRR